MENTLEYREPEEGDKEEVDETVLVEKSSKSSKKRYAEDLLLHKKEKRVIKTDRSLDDLPTSTIERYKYDRNK